MKTRNEEIKFGFNVQPILYTVYKLSIELDDIIFTYFGLTSDIRQRMSNHKSNAAKGKSPLSAAVSLIGGFANVNVEILASNIKEDTAASMEKSLIHCAKLTDAHNLNKYVGGGCRKNPTTMTTLCGYSIVKLVLDVGEGKTKTSYHIMKDVALYDSWNEESLAGTKLTCHMVKSASLKKMCSLFKKTGTVTVEPTLYNTRKEAKEALQNIIDNSKEDLILPMDFDDENVVKYDNDLKSNFPDPNEDE